MNFDWQRCFSRKRSVRKSWCIKKIRISPLGSELKKQTSVAEKQYQELNKFFKCDRNEEEPVIIKKEKPAITSPS